jgi:hypothetical protein
MQVITDMPFLDIIASHNNTLLEWPCASCISSISIIGGGPNTGS